MRGLEGEAAGPDGLITFGDVTNYVTQEVKAYAFEHGRAQVPYEFGEATGDFILGRRPIPVAAAATAIVLESAQTTQSVAEWHSIENSNDPVAFDFFANKFPNSEMAATARARADARAPIPNSSPSPVRSHTKRDLET